MFDDAVAAAERLRRTEAGENYLAVYGTLSREHGRQEVARDNAVVAAAAIERGLFKTDDGERIVTVDDALACGGERHGGSYPHIVLFYAAGSPPVTWDSQRDTWQLGNTVLWHDRPPTRGQLRELLRALSSTEGAE